MNPQRDADLALVERVLASELSDGQRAKIEDMQDVLRQYLNLKLTTKQRAWAKGLIDEPEYKNLMSSGQCPRGREVELAPVLKNLPKRPPMRRQDDE